MLTSSASPTTKFGRKASAASHKTAGVTSLRPLFVSTETPFVDATSICIAKMKNINSSPQTFENEKRTGADSMLVDDSTVRVVEGRAKKRDGSSSLRSSKT